MATVVRTTGNVFLELDGKSAGVLRKAQPPSIQVELATTKLGTGGNPRRSARVVLGELSASATLSEPGPLVDWLQAAVAGALPPRDGALLVTDANFKLRRRIDFRGARLTGLTWPVLDATDTKQPLVVDLQWVADAATDGAGDGRAVVAPLPGKRKSPMTGNFRVAGLPFDANAITQVVLPDLKVAWVSDRVGGQRPGLQVASRQLGLLSLAVSARQADAARTWVRKLVTDGAIGEDEVLTLQVELLDATMKKVLVAVELKDCMLVGLDEDPLESTVDRAPGLTLHFDVAGLAFSLPA